MTYTAAQIETYCRTLLPGYDAWARADGFTFDVNQAKRAVDFFCEVLTLTTDRWMGEPFIPLPWMVAVIGNIHGWRRKSDNTRRYRKVLITTARKSSKSHVAAGLGLYHLFADGEQNPSIVCAAGSAEQASIIYGICAKMVEQEPELAKRSETMARAIRNLSNSGVLRFVNSAAGTKHGTNESMVVIDELHVVDDPALVDALETATRTRKQPLTVYTTTAGDNPAGLWAEVFDYAQKVRDGVHDDPEFLPCMWQAGTDDDIRDPTVWRKAQPSLGVSVTEDEYRRDLSKALEVPRYMPVFKQLSLNLPTESHAAWIPLDNWKQCESKLDREALKGKPAYLGIDLSSTQDTTAVVAVIPHDGRYYVDPLIFLPRDNIAGLFRRQKRDKAPYQSWAASGHIVATDGNCIDYDMIFERIRELAEWYNIVEVQIDPYNASGISEKLTKLGLTVTLVRQGWSLAQATRETERMILSGELVHPGNPALTWEMSNAVVHTDRQENIWLDKAKSTRRIDAAVALVMAVNGCRFGLGRNGNTADSDDVGFMIV